LNLKRRVSLESFFSVAQMALAGFGHGLVPEGVARTLGVREDDRISLRGAGLHRPVRFVARKSMFSQPLVQTFYQAVSELAETV
jgi:DNA-binding transcriptional LysR family regulator